MKAAPKSSGGDEVGAKLGEVALDLAQPETEEGSLRKTARSRGALGWKPLGTRRGDDPEDLGDDAAGLQGLKKNSARTQRRACSLPSPWRISKRNSPEELEGVAGDCAAPAPATAWPGREFSVNRGFF